MVSGICLLVPVCLTFVTGSQIMVINNQRALTETRHFLEQNVTQDCFEDISLDSEINLECCKTSKTTREWSGEECGWFYKCDVNLHCIHNIITIIVFSCFILLLVVSVCAICSVKPVKDCIRRWRNQCSNLPPISGRRTEANSMEMN